MSNDTIMERVQSDAAERLRSFAAFEDVAVIVYGEGDIESEAMKALGVQNAHGGKIGACVVVYMPGLEASSSGASPNAPGPIGELVLAVDVYECSRINHSADGSGVSAEKLAWHALRALHRFYPLGYSGQWYVGQKMVSPLPTTQNVRGYRVHVRIPCGVDGLVKLATPTLAAVDAGSGNFTVSATHDDGAAVLWYSTDESLPRPNGEGSAKYGSPITLKAPFILRCVAVKAEYENSNPAFLEVSA